MNSGNLEEHDGPASKRPCTGDGIAGIHAELEGTSTAATMATTTTADTSLQAIDITMTDALDAPSSATSLTVTGTSDSAASINPTIPKKPSGIYSLPTELHLQLYEYLTPRSAAILGATCTSFYSMYTHLLYTTAVAGIHEVPDPLSAEFQGFRLLNSIFRKGLYESATKLMSYFPENLGEKRNFIVQQALDHAVENGRAHMGRIAYAPRDAEIAKLMKSAAWTNPEEITDDATLASRKETSSIVEEQNRWVAPFVWNELKDTFLRLAIRAGDTELLSEFIENGANPNAPGNEKPLMLAVRKWQKEKWIKVWKTPEEVKAEIDEEDRKKVEEEMVKAAEEASIMQVDNSAVDGAVGVSAVDGVSTIAAGTQNVGNMTNGTAANTVGGLHPAVANYPPIPGQQNSFAANSQNSQNDDERSDEGSGDEEEGNDIAENNSQEMDVASDPATASATTPAGAHKDALPQGKWVKCLNPSFNPFAVIDTLITYGATVKCRDYRGRSLLHYVYTYHKNEHGFMIFTYLVSCGAPIDTIVPGDHRRSLLHELCADRFPTDDFVIPAIELILKKGADPNYVDNGGRTALHEVMVTAYHYPQPPQNNPNTNNTVQASATPNFPRPAENARRRIIDILLNAGAKCDPPFTPPPTTDAPATPPPRPRSLLELGTLFEMDMQPGMVTDILPLLISKGAYIGPGPSGHWHDSAFLNVVVRKHPGLVKAFLETGKIPEAAQNLAILKTKELIKMLDEIQGERGERWFASRGLLVKVLEELGVEIEVKKVEKVKEVKKVEEKKVGEEVEVEAWDGSGDEGEEDEEEGEEEDGDEGEDEEDGQDGQDGQDEDGDGDDDENEDGEDEE